MGFGVNIVTGDYSRGAAGLWIRDGELAFPVSEVTIAGTLQEMLLNLEAIGADLEFRGSMAAPTLKIGEMTVTGRQMMWERTPRSARVPLDPLFRRTS